MNVPARATAARRSLLRATLDLWDRLAMYLPLVLMAVLALLTYWMVRIAPDLLEPEPAETRVDEVSFFMRGATMTTYGPDGQLQHRLTGAEMRHYAGSDTVEVDQPAWWSQGPDGRVTRASAQRALSHDDGSRLQLQGNAVVVREATGSGPDALPRLTLRSDYLQLFADDERIESHLPVQLTRGNDQFRGDRFRYDHARGVIELEGRVQARLAARPGEAATTPP